MWSFIDEDAELEEEDDGLDGDGPEEGVHGLDSRRRRSAELSRSPRSGKTEWSRGKKETMKKCPKQVNPFFEKQANAAMLLLMLALTAVMCGDHDLDFCR